MLTFFALIMAISVQIIAEPQIEFLGVIERQASLRGTAISPGTDKYPPRFIAGFDTDGTWIVNLKDGSSRQVKAPGFDKEHICWPVSTGSYGNVHSFDPKPGRMALVGNDLYLTGHVELRRLPEAVRAQD